MLKTIIVVLKLAGLDLPNLIEKVSTIVGAIALSAYFGTPFPALADIIAARLALSNAITAAELNPSRENKKIVRDKKKELMELMELGRQYVQGIARTNPLFAENIAVAAGMSLKNLPGRKPQTYGVMNTSIPGTVALLSVVYDIEIYHWQLTMSPQDASSWVTIGITDHADFMKAGLISGNKYFFRVGNGGKVETEVFKSVGETVVL